jgi:hypothetical protein
MHESVGLLWASGGCAARGNRGGVVLESPLVEPSGGAPELLVVGDGREAVPLGCAECFREPLEKTALGGSLRGSVLKVAAAGPRGCEGAAGGGWCRVVSEGRPRPIMAATGSRAGWVRGRHGERGSCP